MTVTDVSGYTAKGSAELLVGVSLETSCTVDPECQRFSVPLYRQMSDGRFEDMAAMPLMPVDEWEAAHRTARKRAWRADRHGYWAGIVRRELHSDDIHKVNTSADRRQGRPMADHYLKPYQYGPLHDYQCTRHLIRSYGVTLDGVLVAYLWLYCAGQLRLCSSIIGHKAHLDNGIMYLMWREMLRGEHERDRDGIVMYHRWDNGQDGLRFYKERVGLRETGVRWLP